MYYSFAIETDAETAKADATETKLKLNAGVIHQVRIRNHEGNRGTVHISLWHQGRQIWPGNNDDDFHGDGLNIEWTEFYELIPALETITARTWNDSTLFSHEVVVDFAVLPRWVVAPLLETAETTGGFGTLVGETEEE
ncbi:hypothetical protein D4Q85_00665 [bacterium]|nr:MAG: hypothetical protein D4Q85_00665 [bacterium]